MTKLTEHLALVGTQIGVCVGSVFDSFYGNP